MRVGTTTANYDFKEQLLAKIKNGNAAPKFQIGGQAYTVKEWAKFIERFDSSEDAVRKAIEEEAEKAVNNTAQVLQSDLQEYILRLCLYTFV